MHKKIAKGLKELLVDKNLVTKKLAGGGDKRNFIIYPTSGIY
ncbi:MULTISPECIES: hypothetical protein [unclassified Colwellia]|jgi:hypothetical protein|nr:MULTISPECIES: hypothetical protein [unclassified Colwellia]